MNKLLFAAIIAAGMGTTALSHAIGINEAMSKAIASHPEVLSAAAEQQSIKYRIDAARAGYKPNIDFTAGTGYEWSKNSTTRFRAARTPGSDKQGSRDMWRNEARINATQMLFDGKQTRSRVGQEKSRFEAAGFHALDVQNQLALRAAEAYLFVLRSNEQVALAQTTLETHQVYLNKIQQRTAGGRSAQSDIEQVQGRLALAQANLEAAKGEAQQAQSAYLEAVGEMPNSPVKGDAPFASLPANTQAALDRAMANSPVIASAQANIKAANAQLAEAKCVFCPRITAEGGISRNANLDGVDGPNNDITAMLMYRQAIYAGGRNVATRDERAELVNVAQAELEKDRRLVEKSVLDAMARIEAAKARLDPLNRHVESASRTRDAYLAQFDLGQRSLLDLLDSEVELANAKAGLIDGKYETDAAAYAVMAHTGDLVNVQTQVAAAE